MNFRQFKSDVSSNIVVSSGVRGNTICDPSDSCNCDPSDTCITGGSIVTANCVLLVVITPHSGGGVMSGDVG